MVEHGVNNDHIIGLKGNYRFKSGFFKKLFCKNADIVTWPLEYERRIFQVRKTDLIGRCQRMSRRKGNQEFLMRNGISVTLSEDFPEPMVRSTWPFRTASVCSLEYRSVRDREISG